MAPTEPVPALMDNQTALAWTEGNGKEFSLRHVRTAYHRVREAVALNEVKFQYIKSAQMPADMFTKALDVKPSRGVYSSDSQVADSYTTASYWFRRSDCQNREGTLLWQQNKRFLQ